LEGDFLRGRTGNLTAESAAGKVGVGAYFSEFPFFLRFILLLSVQHGGKK